MAVLTCAEINLDDLQTLLAKFDLTIISVEDDREIPGSWFGDSEAGIIKNKLYIRMDTPVHSALHESCHYICMDNQRRQQLDTNAAGDYDEENGVCYMQILLSDHIPGFGQQRIFNDMDEWGYTFRLGSSRVWFEQDAEDAKDWLIKYGLIDEHNQLLWTLRQN
ncbi:MAG: hypothetical protein OQK70_03470 [Gammaproteobacteria bacterium]|nr:hypothetical protein [Gammaproteobacteria bacterium]